MRRRFKISVEGHDYDVVVEEVTDDGGGLYPDRGTMRSAPAEPSQTAGVSVAPATAAGAARPATGPGDVLSPLAGIVQSIDVKLGAAVKAETRVVTLEAMKTKTMVAAGRAGTVSAIAVDPGQGVEVGQALLTIT
jgi:biotin carboxyl carrier protein